METCRGMFNLLSHQLMMHEPESLEFDCTPRVFDTLPRYALASSTATVSPSAEPEPASMDIVVKPSPSPPSQEQDVQGSPVFPPELEREIFLLTAKTYRGTTVRLMLVAHRVHEWIEAHLYNTIVLRGAGHTARFLACLHQRPSSRAFAAECISSLCIRPGVPLSLAQHVLSLCTGISTVALWVSPNADAPKVLEPLLDKLPLCKLSVNLSTLLTHPGAGAGRSVAGAGGNGNGQGGGGKRLYGLAAHPLFSRLSHLDIVNHWALWTSTLGLERLPNLTHVSFRFWARGNVGSALRLLLNECERLEVLVLLSDKVVLPMAQRYLESEGVCDHRVVVLRYSSDAENWEELQRGGMGAWERAERTVRWRRRTGAGPYDLPEDA